jgi:hypothetical protein
MVGRFDRPAHFLALIYFVVMFAAGVGSARADILHGQSQDLGIRFEAAGGMEWCKPNVVIRLTADKASVFQPETVPFLQMIGRIRAVVMDECPATESLFIEGVIKGRPVFASEMSRLTRWRRLVTLDHATRRPLCTLEADQAECQKRTEAYITARQLMRGKEFAETEITTMLEASNPDHLIWTSGVATGKLRIADRADFSGVYSTGAQLADGIIADISNVCVQDGGMPSPSLSTDYNVNLTQRALLCRQPQDTPVQNVVLVHSTDTRFKVFSFRSEGAQTDAATTVALRLASAIQTNR